MLEHRNLEQVRAIEHDEAKLRQLCLGVQEQLAVRKAELAATEAQREELNKSFMEHLGRLREVKQVVFAAELKLLSHTLTFAFIRNADQQGAGPGAGGLSRQDCRRRARCRS